MNPFRAKAIKAREIADRYSRPTAHDAAMANAFPLGAGFGRKGADKHLESTIRRATKAVAARERAAWLEAQAVAFDAGKINAQGRRPSINADKNAAAADRRKARIADAKARCEGKRRHEVNAETWADAFGYFGGPARAMVIEDHPTCETNVCACPQMPTLS